MGGEGGVGGGLGGLFFLFLWFSLLSGTPAGGLDWFGGLWNSICSSGRRQGHVRCEGLLKASRNKRRTTYRLIKGPQW